MQNIAQVELARCRQYSRLRQREGRISLGQDNQTAEPAKSDANPEAVECIEIEVHADGTAVLQVLVLPSAVARWQAIQLSARRHCCIQ